MPRHPGHERQQNLDGDQDDDDPLQYFHPPTGELYGLGNRPATAIKTLFVHRAATRYTDAAMERLPLANKTPLLSVCVFLAGCSVMPETLLVLNPSSQYPRRSEGAIEPLNDGRLGFVYTRFTGGNKDDSPADIVVRTSRDAGGHWGRERLLVSRDGSSNVMSVSLLRLAGGELLLFYLRKSGCSDCLMYVQRSADELATLSPPVRVTITDGYHVVNNDRIVQLTGGRIIVPAAWHPCPDGTDKTWSPYAVCRAFFSDDDGRTWQASADVPGPRETRPVVLQEPGVVELADGRLLMWMRTNQPSQYQCYSRDRGEHWSEPQPGPLISAPYSPASIKRIPWTGHLLCVWNDHSGRHPYPNKANRTPLCLAVSPDDGLTWTPSQVIEPDQDGWYCYTSITFYDHRAILSYCAGDSKIGRLNRLKVLAIPRRLLQSLEHGM